jgi:hypothetical protein
VFFAHKKRITERNSHLAGEASGSSNSNGCQAKTEHRTQLAVVGTGRGETKPHASVAGSRIAAFLATAAPWKPYFTDNSRNIVLEVISLSIIPDSVPSQEIKRADRFFEKVAQFKYFANQNFI